MVVVWSTLRNPSPPPVGRAFPDSISPPPSRVPEFPDDPCCCGTAASFIWYVNDRTAIANGMGQNAELRRCEFHRVPTSMHLLCRPANHLPWTHLADSFSADEATSR